MKENRNPAFLMLILTVLLILCAVSFLGLHTLKEIRNTQDQLSGILTDAEEKEAQFEQTLTQLQQENEKLAKVQEEIHHSADSSLEEPEPSEEIFSGESLVDITPTPTPSPTPTPAVNGHKVAIDPGHQGSWVDMSAPEPDGPGSSQTKARCSTGTQGTYTGLPEYQLNLDISLKLEALLKERGYEVFLTRTTNDDNISNMERAQAASASGAQIYVRIHANGEESHTSSGALTMCPSPSNPYVAYLSESSYRLSQVLLDAYCQTTGFSNLGVQYSDTMTGINWSEIPVTILEMGFMTNENDDRQMADSAFQEIMVSGIADGIDAYFAEADSSVF